MNIACVRESAERICVCVCMCVVIFFSCDVHNSMTDAGMRVPVCAAVRKFEVVRACVCVCELKAAGN